jgi:hypothetical protein
MTPSKILTSVCVLCMLTLVAVPASAQRGGRQSPGPRGGAIARGAPHASAPRFFGVARRTNVVTRGEFRQRAVFTARRGVVRVGPGPRVMGRPVVRVAPYRLYRPYYNFRPRFSVGFGISVGYPVAYPYFYGYSYGYPAPYPYAYAYRSYRYPPAPYAYSGYPPSSAPNPVAVQPGTTASTGGVSFEITPTTAAVYVNGAYVGTVADFGSTSQPLALAPGRYRIEVRAGGYETMVFDADVTQGRVIPYQGTLRPIR